MSGPATHLRDAFLEDHRELIYGLAELRAAVEGGDFARASQLADELDRAVGAHIDFEEHEFYPALRDKFGPDFVDQLYREHAAGREALETLRSLDAGATLEAGEREQVLEQLRIVSEHALSCGSLTSYLDALPAERQRRMLASLERSRARGARWTESEAVHSE